MRRFSLSVAVLMCGLFLQGWTPATAQEKSPLAPVSGSYAIRNVTVIPRPGQVIDRGVIIIKNGLIDAVGVDLPIPPEAVVIDADSLYAYAAFIDGLSHTGVARDEEENHERVQDPGNPTPGQAGITPQRDVRDYLDPGDRSVRDLRCAGFGAAVVVPKGIFLPGKAAIVLLGGDTADEMVLKPGSACYSELSPNKTVYPSTVMALMAKWRELYRQAVLAKQYSETYASGSQGLPRPSTGRILESLYPVTSGEQPVLFKTRNVLDVQRVLTLQKELGFRLIMADIQEGWDLTGKIRDSGAKVFLTLDLPEDPEAKKKTEKETGEKKDTLADPEIEALKERRTAFIQKMVSQAVAFDAADIKFGFSVLGTRYGDIHKNLCRMLEAGLKPESALAALTVDAAELLGVGDRLGTIDEGKIANVVLFDKPMFDKEAKVTMAFVDGKPYACEEKTSRKKSTVTLEGSWSFTAQAPQETIDLQVVFKRSSDNQWSGSISGSKLPRATDLNSVSLYGKSLKFNYDIIYEGKSYEVAIDGQLEDETFSGNMNVGEFGQFPVEGVKDPKH